MTQAAPAMAAASPYEHLRSAEQASTFSAAEIRQAIAHWVACDRLDIADALVAAGMSLHPDSQDILAVGALLAEINQDWAQAQECLERLLALQGDAATGESWYHLVRVMRCRSAYHSAWRTATQALQQHPRHEGLAQEQAELAELLATVPVPVETRAQHG